MQQTFSLTLKANGIARVIQSEVFVTPPPINGAAATESVTIQAIWDTGATGSVITADVAAALSLAPISQTKVHTASGEDICNVYLVNITLPNGVTVEGVRVTEGKITGAQALIGMDIIAIGDFAITHPDGKTQVTFRIPSIADIDFVREANESRPRQQNSLGTQRAAQLKRRKKGQGSR